MLEKIKAKIFEKYKPGDVVGIFLSGFDKDGRLLVSEGMLQTDKPLETSVEEVFNKYLLAQKNIAFVLCDLVKAITQENNTENVLKLSMKTNGLVLVGVDNDKSGVILPDTEGIADAKNALFLIKQKYGITGRVEIFVFQTERLTIS